MICRAFDNDPQRMMQATVEELVDIQGVGEVIARTFCGLFFQMKHTEIFSNASYRRLSSRKKKERKAHRFLKI